MMRVTRERGRLGTAGAASFTLVEMLIAVALFIMAFGFIVAGLNQTMYMAVWGNYNTAASKWAQQRMEEIQNARWDPTAVPAVDQVISANFPNDTVVLENYGGANPSLTATRTVTITPVTAGNLQYKVIQIAMSWSFRGRSFSKTFTNIRATDQ